MTIKYDNKGKVVKKIRIREKQSKKEINIIK